MRNLYSAGFKILSETPIPENELIKFDSADVARAVERWMQER
jgi:hypothetical protein